MKKIKIITPLICMLLFSCNNNPWGTGGLEDTNYQLNQNSYTATFTFRNGVKESDFFDSDEYLGHPNKKQIIDKIDDDLCSNVKENLFHIAFSKEKAEMGPNNFYLLNNKQYEDGFRSSKYIYSADGGNVILYDTEINDEVVIVCVNVKNKEKDYHSCDKITINSIRKINAKLDFSFHYNFIQFNYEDNMIIRQADARFIITYDKII